MDGRTFTKEFQKQEIKTMTTGQMYFISICDGLKNVFIYSSVIIIAVFITMFIVLVSEDYDSNDNTIKFIKRFFLTCTPIMIIFIFAAVLIPTSKQMTTIVVIPKIANAERLDNVNPEVYDIALEWLKKIESEEK